MIEQILPSGVAVAEALTDPPDVLLFPEEEALIARAVDKRRREFSTVRHCARTALTEIGFDPVPILRGPRGAPMWPAGVVGSMTHCDGYRAAALGRADTFATIGIDAEPHAPLPDGVLDAVARPAERKWIDAGAPGVCWDRLLFCAKEAVYKAWYPITGRWLGFEEAEIALDPVVGSFVATLLVEPPTLGGAPVTAFTGRYQVVDGLILAAIAVPAPA